LTDGIRLFRFLIVGAGASVIQILILAVCLNLFGLRNEFSVVIAYIASVVFHFLVNRRFTFQMEQGPKIVEVFRYLTIVLINLLITLLVSTAIINIFGLNAYIATIFSICATICVSFFSSKYWVFKK